MKAIRLTRGKIALVDDEDYERVNQYKWYAYFASNTIYARRRPWNKIIKKYSVQSIHRFILNAPKGMEVDHINGNGLDNRKANLRLCTRQQNCYNHRVRNTSKSGITGISWDTQTNKWRATITLNGKMINIGRFVEIEDAINARKKKAFELFSPFNRS